jgi:integrative and conjugative element protein (TIGR02256 family)
MVEFTCFELGISIILTDKVIEKFRPYQQTPGKSKPEAGGLLFCTNIDSSKIVVSDIAPPSDKDIRKPFFFKHDAKHPNKVIKEKRSQGYHYIGDWHSHPQKFCTPSRQDERSILSLFNQSTHDLNFMCHLILSNSDIQNSYVCLTNGKKIYSCK